MNKYTCTSSSFDPDLNKKEVLFRVEYQYRLKSPTSFKQSLRRLIMQMIRLYDRVTTFMCSRTTSSAHRKLERGGGTHGGPYAESMGGRAYD